MILFAKKNNTPNNKNIQEITKDFNETPKDFDEILVEKISSPFYFIPVMFSMMVVSCLLIYDQSLDQYCSKNEASPRSNFVAMCVSILIPMIFITSLLIEESHSVISGFFLFIFIGAILLTNNILDLYMLGYSDKLTHSHDYFQYYYGFVLYLCEIIFTSYIAYLISDMYLLILLAASKFICLLISVIIIGISEEKINSLLFISWAVDFCLFGLTVSSHIHEILILPVLVMIFKFFSFIKFSDVVNKVSVL